MTTPEHEERVANAVTYKLTGELRYRVAALKAEGEFIVYDSLSKGVIVWRGASRATAVAVMQNMNGLDLE